MLEKLNKKFIKIQQNKNCTKVECAQERQMSGVDRVILRHHLLELLLLESPLPIIVE